MPSDIACALAQVQQAEERRVTSRIMPVFARALLRQQAEDRRVTSRMMPVFARALLAPQVQQASSQLPQALPY